MENNMADWFKFYNDGLDEPRLQYAISENPSTVSVWLLILSEASKKRCGSITWRDQDFELFGYAKKLNLSVPVLNQCISILERIEYIKRHDGVIEIPEWEKRQSDYAKGLDKGYYKKTSKLLASDSEVSTIRREEKREEEKRKENTVATLPRFQKPTIEAVKLQAAKIGLADAEADKFFNYYESNGWRVGRNPMKSWVHAMTNWKNNAQSYQPANKIAPSPVSGAAIVVLGKELERVIEQMRVIKATYGDHQTWSSDDVTKFKQLRSRRDELRKQLGVQQ